MNGWMNESSQFTCCLDKALLLQYSTRYKYEVQLYNDTSKYLYKYCKKKTKNNFTVVDEIQ